MAGEDTGANQPNANGENGDNQPNTNGDVTMKQADFDSKFSGAFAKGATKATKELLATLEVESIEVLQAKLKSVGDTKVLSDEIATLKGNEASLKGKLALKNLALKNKVSDIEYFEYLYDKAKGDEAFNADNFISSLKESNPNVFIKVTGGLNNPRAGEGNTGGKTITQSDYALLSPDERNKYKAKDIKRG